MPTEAQRSGGISLRHLTSSFGNAQAKRLPLTAAFLRTFILRTLHSLFSSNFSGYCVLMIGESDAKQIGNREIQGAIAEHG